MNDAGTFRDGNHLETSHLLWTSRWLILQGPEVLMGGRRTRIRFVCVVNDHVLALSQLMTHRLLKPTCRRDPAIAASRSVIVVGTA